MDDTDTESDLSTIYDTEVASLNFDIPDIQADYSFSDSDHNSEYYSLLNSPERAPERTLETQPERSPLLTPIISPERSPVRSPVRYPERSPVRYPVRSPVRPQTMSDTGSDEDDFSVDVRVHPDFRQARRRARAAQDAADAEAQAADAAALEQYEAYMLHVDIDFYYPEHLDNDGDHIDAARMCAMGYLCLTRAGAGSVSRKHFWTWFKAQRELEDGPLLKKIIKTGNTYIRMQRREILKNTCEEIGAYIVDNHFALFTALKGNKSYFADVEWTETDPETMYIKHLQTTAVQTRIFRTLGRYFRPEITKQWKLPIMKALTDTILYMQRDLFEFVVEHSTSNAFNKYNKMPESLSDSFKRLNDFTVLHPHDLNKITVNNINMLSVGLSRDTGDNSTVPIAVKPRGRHHALLPVLPGQARPAIVPLPLPNQRRAPPRPGPPPVPPRQLPGRLPGSGAGAA